MILHARQDHYQLTIRQKNGQHFHIVLGLYTACLGSPQCISGITIITNVIFICLTDYGEKLIAVSQTRYFLVV